MFGDVSLDSQVPIPVDRRTGGKSLGLGVSQKTPIFIRWICRWNEVRFKKSLKVQRHSNKISLRCSNWSAWLRKTVKENSFRLLHLLNRLRKCFFSKSRPFFQAFHLCICVDLRPRNRSWNISPEQDPLQMQIFQHIRLSKHMQSPTLPLWFSQNNYAGSRRPNRNRKNKREISRNNDNIDEHKATWKVWLEEYCRS